MEGEEGEAKVGERHLATLEMKATAVANHECSVPNIREACYNDISPWRTVRGGGFGEERGGGGELLSREYTDGSQEPTG